MPVAGTIEGLQDALAAGLEAVAHPSAPRPYEVIADNLGALLSASLGDEWKVIPGGQGQGTEALVPFVSMQPGEGVASPTFGVYPVYLFAANGECVFLSLNQGVYKTKGREALAKRALDVRDGLGQQAGLDVAIDLGHQSGLPRDYEAGNVYALEYSAGSLPDDERLSQDLGRMLNLAQEVERKGLVSTSAIEPVHVVLKWSLQYGEIDQLDEHRRIAKERGSVWWGSLKGMGPRRLAQMEEQIAEGALTHAFIRGPQGTSFAQAEVVEVQKDRQKVDPSRLPSDLVSAEFGVFFRLANFRDLPASWPEQHLRMASGLEMIGQPQLKNQASPLYVYEVGAPAAPPAPTPVPNPNTGPGRIDLERLERETFWRREELEELVASLTRPSGKGQVILAGPPGTSKTWIAKHVAQALTGSSSEVTTVQFHPSYGYEEFVEGVRPIVDDSGHLQFAKTNGVVVDICKRLAAQDEDAVHALIVDELNRANVPRVFGELLYLLEYRDDRIRLQYSAAQPGGDTQAESFALPDGFRIIATMNTADRSTRSIDVALRRRFDIFECPPSPDVLTRYYEQPGRETQVTDLVEGFSRLNENLEAKLDRHHTIGHTFFMKDTFTRAELERVWLRQVWPLIDDYFFDQPAVAREQFTLEHFWPS